MTDEPTVAPALAEVPVAGADCLEAGAGAGNTTAALAERGAASVLAVTDDADHATGVRKRFADEASIRTVRADLRHLPLADEAVRVTTAHALFGVLSPAAASEVVQELTRVTASGGWLALVDYDPIPDETVRELFALENAAALLTDGEPALEFYPEGHLAALFSRAGWQQDDSGTALEPVPWTADLLDAHAEIARSTFQALPDPAAGALASRADEVRERAGDEVDSGRMYYQTFRLADVTT